MHVNPYPLSSTRRKRSLEGHIRSKRDTAEEQRLAANREQWMTANYLRVPVCQFGPEVREENDTRLCKLFTHSVTDFGLGFTFNTRPMGEMMLNTKHNSEQLEKQLGIFGIDRMVAFPDNPGMALKFVVQQSEGAYKAQNGLAHLKDVPK